ncbi:MAG: GTPase [Planctomycetota bacterium]
MVYDTEDTVAAIATAVGAAPRGMVRVSGPDTLSCIRRCFQPQRPDLLLNQLDTPSVIDGIVLAGGSQAAIPCDLFYWPTQRSYTRQPTAELHTIGSPPLLHDVLQRVLACGARLAEPGEFTLRAFLAGRLDLTQAEAILGVIDAQSDADLQSALGQLAGGLSQSLTEVREKLLYLLAELEAGLDFVDEDIEFVSRDQLGEDLRSVADLLLVVQDQLSLRSDTRDLPRVVLSGPPNAGKSSLFNALAAKYSEDGIDRPALVADQSGTTRDFVSATLHVNGIAFHLIDTAGLAAATTSSIDQFAQQVADSQREQADLIVECISIGNARSRTLRDIPGRKLIAFTKSDLRSQSSLDIEDQISCSSLTGNGVSDLAGLVADRLREASTGSGNSLTSSAARCAASLRQAVEATTVALELVANDAGEEIIAAEIRQALTSIGHVVGAIYTDDILDRVFSQFCIGK